MRKAKILFLDIETAPAISAHWAMFKQNIGPVQVIRDWYILCYAAEWLDNSKIITDAIWKHRKEYKEDMYNDRTVVQGVKDLINQADIVVAHNGDDFDLKKIKTRMLFHRMPPYKPIKTVDTLKVARYNFGFMSNSLEHILRTMKLGHKKEHCGFGMWDGAMNGRKRDQIDMLRYNVVDTKKLKEAYKLMLPYMERHPNVNLYAQVIDREACPNCGSSDVQARGRVPAIVRLYQQFQCQDCKRWFRSHQAIKDTKKKK